MPPQAGPHSTPPETMTWSVQMLVVDAGTVRVTDSGTSNEHSDPAALDRVTTDYSAAPLDENRPG